jgi:hypothetical protein
MGFVNRFPIIKIASFCILLSYSSFPQDRVNDFSDHIRTLTIDGENKTAL